MDTEVLKPIKEYQLREFNQSLYIPVLDRDPVYAARALTKKDIVKAYCLLKEVFQEIKDNNIYHEPLVNTLLYSRENFMWYVSFFKELKNITRDNKEFEIPYEKCPFSKGTSSIALYQPFYAHTRKGTAVLFNYKVLSKKLPPINNYRIKYIMENYDMSDFIDDCYPAWYLIKRTTIFEQYSEKTNTRVRIDFREGEFHYYIAGASDNWQKIEYVPVEMDHVISALLFRSYSKD